ncbi:MAG: sulfatase-like hydrolase/transferase [Planctomycetes bacterium]|nr:sulfatase-like hydrolase/transferase [Planctomycetota bacterium]
MGVPDGPAPRSDETCTANRPNTGPANPWNRPHFLLLLGVWFGLLTGFAEGGGGTVAYLLQRVSLNQYSASAIWMAPVAEATLFGMIGLVFSLLARLCFRGAWLLGIVAVFGTCLFLVVIFRLNSLLSIGLHPYASFLLALGLAVQVGRFATRHSRGFCRLVLRTTPAMLVLVGIVAGSMIGWRWFTERRMLANLPPASTPSPNVLFIVLDTVRAKNMSLYGYSRETTPNLDRLAERGVVFEQAISPSPWTLPSHASMFTGRYPHEHSADFSVPLGRDCPTLAEALYARGYVTAGFVANTGFCGRQTGLNRGFVHYEEHGTRLCDFIQYSFITKNACEAFQDALRYYDLTWWNRIDARQINTSLLDWLPSRPKNRPFLVFLNYFDCHDTYLPEHPFGRPNSRHSREEKRLLRANYHETYVCGNLNPEHQALAEDAYDGCLLELDERIAELLTDLEKHGHLRDTYVIITSDHGEQFGEHGLTYHADSLYRPLLHVPLIVIPPEGTPSGWRVDGLVSLRDLPATVLDLLALQTVNWPGESFADDVTNHSAGEHVRSSPLFAAVSQGKHFPDRHPSSPGSVGAVWIDGMQYIREYATGRERLYDFANDREEEHDLVRSAEYVGVLEKCRQTLSGIDAHAP